MLTPIRKNGTENAEARRTQRKSSNISLRSPRLCVSAPRLCHRWGSPQPGGHDMIATELSKTVSRAHILVRSARQPMACGQTFRIRFSSP